MLIGFVGASSSGKTTCAAGIFANLIDLGYPVEFIPDHAKRYVLTLPNRPLNDEDHVNILTSQRRIEELLIKSAESIVISDGSIYNSLLYLSPEGASSVLVKDEIQAAASRYSILFRCSPMIAKASSAKLEESYALDERLREILGSLQLHATPLSGSTKERVNTALNIILDVMASCD